MSKPEKPLDDSHERETAKARQQQAEPPEAEPVVRGGAVAEVLGPITKLAREQPPTPPGPMEPPLVSASAQATPEAEFPELKTLSVGQIGAMGIEALEAYRQGERHRWDKNGALWRFRREAVGNQFQVTIDVSLLGVTLATGAVPLDRLPSAAGEEQVLCLVDDMAKACNDAAKAVRKRQAALAKEAEADAKEARAAAKEG